MKQFLKNTPKGKGWKTRKTGSKRQVGKRFQLQTRSKRGLAERLPKTTGFTGRIPVHFQKSRLQNTTSHLAQEMKEAGMKGWTIGVRYKDGATEEIPVVAKGAKGAIDKAIPKMNQNINQIDELTVVDPSLREVLHKVGAGAQKVIAVGKKVMQKVTPLAKKGFAETKGLVKATGRGLERGALAASRIAGRTAALPSEMGETYEEAVEERPWTEKGEIGHYMETGEKTTGAEALEDIEKESRGPFHGKPFGTASPLATSQSPLLTEIGKERWTERAESEYPEELKRRYSPRFFDVTKETPEGIRRYRAGNRIVIELEDGSCPR